MTAGPPPIAVAHGIPIVVQETDCDAMPDLEVIRI
jgi:hypothetical protein